MKRPRPILLAEDNPNDVELILSAFQEANFVNEIHVTNDGEQALDFLHRRGAYATRTGPQPAVILLDLKMPKVDGHEVLRQIRADPRLAHTHVVVLTSSDQEADITRSRELGSDAYLVKPTSIVELIDQLGRLSTQWQRNPAGQS